MNMLRKGVEMLTIDGNHAGQRIDNFLIAHCKGVSKQRLYRAIRKGEVRINGSRVKPLVRLNEGDIVRVPPLTVLMPSNANQAMDVSWLADCVLFEDDALLVVDKPAGLSVHDGTGVHMHLLAAAALLRPDETFLRLVHRIDRATSGCVMIAKNRETLLDLQNQFKNRTVEKHYLACCLGVMPQRSIEATQSLYKRTESTDRDKVVVDERYGKHAKSVLRCNKQGRASVLIDIDLYTGRMHQIRVHCAHHQLPILGDDKYGDWRVNKMLAETMKAPLMLHCFAISCRYRGNKHTFKSKRPDWYHDFEAIDKQLAQQLAKH